MSPNNLRAPIVILDTETLGLALDAPVWEIALIRLDPNGTHTPWQCFVWMENPEAEIQKAIDDGLPEEFAADFRKRYRHEEAVTPEGVRTMLKYHLRKSGEYKAHIAGMVPNFDTEHLLHQGLMGFWHHYHLIDIENLIAGKLGLLPPYDSDELSRLLAIDPDGYDRHTAMGDVLWALNLLDRVLPW